jgi:very-short-patch-repair endonuclease/transposase-like protein
MRIPRPTIQCPVCKKYFKARSFHGKRQIVCSKECFSVYMSTTKSLKQLAEELGTDIKGAMQIIDKEHNENKMTIKAIAEKYGVVRISLMRWCKKYGVKTRTISEDNYRRYSTMTEEQIKEQTRKANEGIRELFKDPQWKEQQIEKVMTAQDMKPSRPENLFYEKITEMGYYPERQYRKDMGGFALDFAFPDIKLAIEIDGEYWHNLEKTKVKDRRRNYFLGVKKGWEVIHIPAKDFTQHSEHYVWEVIQTIETLKIA